MIKQLVSEGVRTNATVIFNSTQGLMAGLAGAHSVAVPFAVFEAMLEHPMTSQGIEHFLSEFEQIKKRP